MFAERGKILRELTLPCGQCIGCKLRRSVEWAMRCMHERQMHDDSCFVTLTYRPEDLPLQGQLVYRHFQLFMKRLRKQRGSVRFFMAGEYGGLYGRPHFHALLFGTDFLDRVPYKRMASGSWLYTSAVLDKLWGGGFSSVGDVTFESAAYVARYCTKKITGRAAESHYERVDESSGEIYQLEPEFAGMSLKPGIGETWYRKYMAEVLCRDAVIVNGVAVKPPRYYDRLLSTLNLEEKEWIDFQRGLKARELGDDYTPDRLRVREQVARARLSFSKRTLE